LRSAVFAVLFVCLTNVSSTFAASTDTITLPANGATVAGSVTISLTAGSGVSWSNLYIDGNYFASTPPVSFTWNSTTVANGAHTISTTAYSSSGATLGKSSITVTVANTTSTLTLTSPIAGAKVSGTITIAANQPSGVEWENFYVDGNWIASTPPYSFSWNTNQIANGAHTISVVSYGSSGELGTSSLGITVANGPTPTATLTVTPTPVTTPLPLRRVPTAVVTPTPTIVPTAAPTAAPTPVPTVAPTIAPTKAPTPVATVAPTAIPTVPPTPVPTATPTTVPTPTEPAVSMLAPANNSVVTGTVTVTAQINSSNVSWLDFYCDGIYLVSSPPDSVAWNSTTVSNGSHTLSVTAFGVGSVNLGSATTTVTVTNVSGAPTPTAIPTSTSKSSSTPTATPTAAASVELRPTNQIPNNTTPTSSQLSSFISGVGGCGGLDTCSYMQQVNGQFSGTTTEILEFAANKWCPNCTILNPYDGVTYSFSDLAKAIAVNESNWYQWQSANLSTPDPITLSLTLTPTHGDLEHVNASQPDGGSWGIFQIAEGADQGWPSTFPLSALSTAFNADFKLGYQMGVEQGHLDYLSDDSVAEAAIANGYPPYSNYTDSNGVLHPASTDINVLRWGAVGQWYSGEWYDSGALSYISQVQEILHNQPWNQPGF
jgi:hypothetical protein